jgi:L,D-peptidoglycan transpeptidase YkuD (ErfK/YbiS/YcfS/YnhG family)
MLITLKNKDTLHFKNFFFKCAIGKKGLTFNKKEGDKKTPKGTFNLDKLYYRKDRLKKPKTKISCIPILKKMGWCDDVNNKNYYNKLIFINKKDKIKCEKMHRRDNSYDLVIPIKFNYKNTKLGKGSAIFIHVTKNYRGTAGCIALKKSDFLILLKLINKNTKIKII